MILAIAGLGLLLLVLGILLFNPNTKWAIQKWFLAIGLLLLIAPFLLRNHCKNSCRQAEGCTANTECHSAKSEKHCAKKCEKKCERKCTMGDSTNVEIERKVIIKDGEEFSISLPKNTFEANDRTVYSLTVTPSSGIVTGAGVEKNGDSFTFNPSVAGVGKHKLSVNGVDVFELEVK